MLIPAPVSARGHPHTRTRTALAAHGRRAAFAGGVEQRRVLRCARFQMQVAECERESGGNGARARVPALLLVRT